MVLDNNQLSGEIPSTIGNLVDLDNLHLGHNNLSGEIPSEIGNLINLNYLSLDNNELTGQIPNSICNLTLNFSDIHFIIHSNKLCPPYPSCLNATIMGWQFCD